MKKILAVAVSFFLLSGCFAPDSIVGSEYKLKQDNELFEIVIGFNKDGTYYSNAINSQKGVYQIIEDNLTLSANNKTNIVPHQDYVSIERNFFSNMKKVKNFKLNGNNLNLYTYDNQVLQFDRIGRSQAR